MGMTGTNHKEVKGNKYEIPPGSLSIAKNTGDTTGL
jgi:hypothetical protein